MEFMAAMMMCGTPISRECVLVCESECSFSVHSWIVFPLFGYFYAIDKSFYALCCQFASMNKRRTSRFAKRPNTKTEKRINNNMCKIVEAPEFGEKETVRDSKYMKKKKTNCNVFREWEFLNVGKCMYAQFAMRPTIKVWCEHWKIVRRSWLWVNT